jgi:hypothetical protein
MADLYKTEGSQSQDTEERDKRTSADGPVTEEMSCAVAKACGLATIDGPTWTRVEAALRAVAPMIAARAIHAYAEVHARPYVIPSAVDTAVVAEREQCAQIADGMKQRSGPVADAIAAAIRARGET